jgi:hypothetical protein
MMRKSTTGLQIFQVSSEGTDPILKSRLVMVEETLPELDFRVVHLEA